jgi:hypothetical protein
MGAIRHDVETLGCWDAKWEEKQVCVGAGSVPLAHSHSAAAGGIHTAHAAGGLEHVNVCRLAETCEEGIVLDHTQVCWC